MGTYGDEPNFYCSKGSTTCIHIITNLTISLVLTTLGISLRNSTLFTRLFLAERCAQAGHETSIITFFEKFDLVHQTVSPCERVGSGEVHVVWR